MQATACTFSCHFPVLCCLTVRVWQSVAAPKKIVLAPMFISCGLQSQAGRGCQEKKFDEDTSFEEEEVIPEDLSVSVMHLSLYRHLHDH